MRTLPLLAVLFVAGCGDTDAATVAPAPSAQPLEAESAVDEPTSAPDDLEDADPTPYEALSDWIGEYSVLEDGTHFVLQPEVRPFLEQAFEVEPGLMDRLSNLDEEPYFLTTPIEYVGGAFALSFVSNGRFNDDERSLYLLIDGETGATFAVLAGDGNVYYRSSYDARVADLEDEAVAWMDNAFYWEPDAPAQDFATLARLSEDAPMSP